MTPNYTNQSDIVLSLRLLSQVEMLSIITILKELTLSDYAISPPRLAEIKDETSMGWTEFYATMEDGKEFCFGTTFHIEFFCMPEDCTAKNIVKITPAVRGEPRKYEQVYQERPFLNAISTNYNA